MNTDLILAKAQSAIKMVVSNGKLDNGIFHYYDQRYILEYADGSYEESPQLLLHHILFYEGIYKLFCSQEELLKIEKQINDDVIYRNDEYMDLLDDIHSIGKEIIESKT